MTGGGRGRRGPRLWLEAAVVLAALVLAAAACGSSDSSGDGNQPAGTAASAPTATGGPDGAGAGTVAPEPAPPDASSNGDVPEAPSGDGTSSGPESQQTTPPDPDPAPVQPPGPTEPLTGEPLEDPSIMGRPALAVKIGTSTVGRPQTGINQADILIEFRVETITRLMAVFHSQGADSLGPVRSARSSDADILANFGQPLFSHSGANPGVLREISQGQAADKLYELRWDNIPSDYWRVGDRVPPWNLYTSTSNIWRSAPSGLAAPEPIFEYRAEAEPLPAGAEPVPGVEIRYLGGTVAHFVWDGEAAGWARWQDGTPHVDLPRHLDGTLNPAVDPVQVAPANVLVLQTRYTSSAHCNYCPEAITVDPEGGAALLFTDGHLVRGRWSRPSAAQPWQVTDNDGNPMRLAPGQTFIVLPGGDVLIMVEDFAEHLLDSR